MAWKLEIRKLGQAGGLKERMARQRKWDHMYGAGSWEIGYVINGEFITQQEAEDTIYYESYKLHFEQHPNDLLELINLAKSLRNPHAVATTGVDLQIPAIERFLRENKLVLQGSKVVDIGSWQGKRSHSISDRLSPIHIKCCISPKLTLEKYWQTKKCLAVWID